jgi:predicted naringenin-chalcone synthase
MNPKIPTYLSSLNSCPTRFRASQLEILSFLTSVHEQSARLKGHDFSEIALLARYAVKEKDISLRGFEINDFFLAPEERQFCKPSIKSPSGATIQDRLKFFGIRAKEVFEYFYNNETNEPEHIIHVTCTGYLSPSAAQLLVAERQWSTEITHAYHMGCYSSLPALRLAIGQAVGFGKTVDLVHTEICSLHVNPNLHTPEQFIVQTLFGDGHIQYQLSQQKKGPSFKVITIKEKIIPNSYEDMTWMPSSNGMAMSLSRNVPDKIHEHIRTFITELFDEAEISLSNTLANGIFAIHPGGPKIIETVGQVLELRAEQFACSKKVLFENGNMSSATLPFIWQQIAQSEIPKGTPIVSLAFGPGLTIFGAVFEFEP